MSGNPERQAGTRRRTTVLCCAAALSWCATGALAQDPPAPSATPAAATPAAPPGVIAGAILDAANGEPVAGATVVLQPEAAGAFPGPAAGSAFASATRTTTTDSAGRYHFDGLPPGAYRVYITRVSYRPYSVGLELRSGAESAVSVGLKAEPIALEPITGGRGGVAAAPFRAFAGWPDAERARLLALELRRQRFLTTDVRELTDIDVAEAVTLAEPDVFRALQRLAGVTGRSDYSAELWTRGAPWSHTRVYFDGVPVYNPLHALGVLSGIGSSAAGAVWFHPGVRSAGIGEGAAGVVDLRSRRGAGDGGLNLSGDLSLMSVGATADQRVLDGRAGWMLSGRRTYLDWLSELTSRATGSDAPFPYGFAEVTGSVDARLGRSTVLETSWLWEEDHLTRPAGDGVDALRTDWGNAIARVTLGTRAGELNTRHTVAFSRHAGAVLTDTEPETMASERRLGDSRVGYAGVSGTLWPDAVTIAGPAWTAGYALEAHAVGYDGLIPLPVPRMDAVAVASEDSFADSLLTTWSHALPMAVLWGERSWTPEERLSIRTGVRVEASESLAGSGPVRVAPRLAVRFAAAPEVSLSAGYGRVYQYTQAVAPGGVHLASLVSSDAWLVAGPEIPALQADLVTAGLEAWLDPGRVVSINGFGRRSTGVALPDPRPGPVFDGDPLLFGENLAYGIETTVRQITGRVTGSAAYTLSRSRVAAGGLDFAAGSDRTHVLDATAMVRALPSLRLGAAFTAATGVPFTRTISDSTACTAEPGCDPATLPWSGTPNELRAPAFASLDLVVDWTLRLSGTEVGIYGQLRNALGRENATVYTGGGPGCLPEDCRAGGLENAYERGIPRLPIIGLRVRR